MTPLVKPTPILAKIGPSKGRLLASDDSEKSCSVERLSSIVHPLRSGQNPKPILERKTMVGGARKAAPNDWGQSFYTGSFYTGSFRRSAQNNHAGVQPMRLAAREATGA